MPDWLCFSFFCTLHSPTLNMDVRVGANSKYKLVKLIGKGSFGAIYLGVFTFDTFFLQPGVCVSTGETVGIKLENKKTNHPQLEWEVTAYRLLSCGGMFPPSSLTLNKVGIPPVRYFGEEGDYNVMVMDLLGPNLEDLFNFCGRKFTPKTVSMLAIQLVRPRLYFR